MKLIGLTQRVEIIEPYGESRDCLDQRWTTLLHECGFSPVPLCNSIHNVKQYIDNLRLSGVILTGGNDISSLDNAKNPAPERDEFEFKLIQHCETNNLPMLGICRGTQILNICYGGQLDELEGHVATRNKISFTEPSPFSKANTYANVNSYHNFGITKSGLANKLKAFALAEDDSIEALMHERYPFFGIIWHPEREEPFLDLDKNAIRRIFGEAT